MKKCLIGIALIAAYALGQSQPRLTIESQRGVDNSNDIFYFVEDKETGTRCYAVTKIYHDGTAISCVERNTRQR